MHVCLCRLVAGLQDRHVFGAALGPTYTCVPSRLLTHWVACYQPPFYSQNRNTLYDKIRFGRLEFPEYLSPNARDLLTRVRK